MTSTMHAIASTATQPVAMFGIKWLDPEFIISSLGAFALVGVCLIIFAECGLLVGFFLPGDSLLFIAGMFTASGAIEAPLWLSCVLLAVCAFLGNAVGYWIGRKAGPALFDRPDSKLFKREYVDKTHEFFERHGARAVVLARFVPIVRTFITAVAGVGWMDPRKYLTYSAIGGVLWACGVTVLGYLLGGVSFIKNHIDGIMVAIVVLSVVPIVLQYFKARREKKMSARETA